MSRVLIVARTRMRGEHVCVGGHDLDRRFRGVRLLDVFGDHWTNDSSFQVGEIWNIRYNEKASARPPHVEDVFVLEYRRMQRVTDLKGFVLKHAKPWTGGPEAIFNGTLRNTWSGSAYIPAQGRLPRCSTGYWVPDEDLIRQPFERARFEFTGTSAVKRLVWVGVEAPPERIDAGSLVRVSLSRRFSSETVPEGYYAQISGVL